MIVWNVEADEINSKPKEEALKLAGTDALKVKYDNTDDFRIGDKVLVWTTGTYNENIPTEGVATNVTKVEQ